MTQRQLSVVVIGVLLFLGLVPMVSMVISSFFSSTGFSLQAYEVLISDTHLWQSFQNSLVLALCVATMTTIVGTFIAILSSKTTLYLSIIWLIILLIPLLIPPYILAYGWYSLLGRNGILGEFLFGFGGTAFVLFSVYLPIPIFIISLFLRRLNPCLEEAARLHCTWICLLAKITLRLILPAVIFSFLLVFLLSVSELSVANFLRYDVFPLQSFIQFSAFYDFKTATVFTMPLLLIVLLVLWVEYFFIQTHTLQLKAQTQHTLIDIDTLQLPLGMILGIVSLLVIGLPLLGLLHKIEIPAVEEVLTHALSPLLRSLGYASVSATFLTFFGFLSAYVIVYKYTKGWQILSSVLLFLFVLSPVLIGIALILFWNHPWSNFIYTTPLILLIAYLLKYLFLSTKVIELKLVQIPSNLLEAAEITSASWYKIIWYILLPLLKDTLLLAWFIGFIFSLRDSTLAMLVAPAGKSTLPTYIFTQMANGKEATIATLCLLMMLSILLPLLGFISYTNLQRRWL